MAIDGESHRSEVKGIWFDSARTFVLRRHGPDVLARLVAELPPEIQPVLRDPIAAEWYPEECLAHMLAAVRRQLTDGSQSDFMRLLEEITIDGVGRFFRLVLSLSSPTFVLKKVPVLWGRMRRGQGRVEVEVRDAVVQVRYADFPWFDDENYRLMTLATLRGVARACGARSAWAEPVRWTADSFVVDVRW